MRRRAAWMSPLTPLSGVPQVHRAVPAEAGRRVLPLRGAEPDGRALAAEIGGPSRMYVCPGRPQTSRGASVWGVPARHLQAPQGREPVSDSVGNNSCSGWRAVSTPRRCSCSEGDKGWRGQCRCPRSAERGPGTRRLLRHELLAAPSPLPTESDVRNVNRTPSVYSQPSPTTVCAETLSLHSKKDVGGDIPDGVQAAEVQFTLCWADPLWGLRQLPRGRDTASQRSVRGRGTGMLAQAGRSVRV